MRYLYRTSDLIKVEDEMQQKEQTYFTFDDIKKIKLYAESEKIINEYENEESDLNYVYNIHSNYADAITGYNSLLDAYNDLLESQNFMIYEHEHNL